MGSRTPGSSSTTKIVTDDGPLDTFLLDLGRRRWRRRREKTCDARRISAASTGLSRCVRLWLAMARRVCVEMSPVKTMAGNFPLEFLPQLCDDLDAIGPIGKIEIGDDESGRSVEASATTPSAAPIGR